MTDLYDDYEIVTTPEFSLKAKLGKNIRLLDLENDFGEVPALIALERVIGKKNIFTVKAFVKKKDAIIKKA